MSSGNPLEQIRRRMQSHATPTAFAALAEEHRRAGRFDEAIAVCRDGLSRYPAYVSARVTLGRALLDSGDVAAALAELEQAVAQAPDNLAAARALESAHTALGNAPPPPPLPSLTDLPLRATEPSSPSTSGSVVAEALAAGPDGPQEFGFGPDWSVPEAPGTPPIEDAAPAATADPTGAEDQASIWGASTDHAEAPTMVVAPRHLQGEEPAGIWAVPEVIVVDAPETADGARVYSWALDAPADIERAGGDDPSAVAPTPDPAGLWDAPTIEAPLAELFALAPFAEERRQTDPVAPVEDTAGAGESRVDTPEPPLVVSEPASAVLEPAAQAVVAGDSVPTDDLAATGSSAPGAEVLDDQSSSFWTGAFGGEPEIAAPAPFSGWGDDAAPADAGADRSPWSETGEDDQTGPWTTPDGPSATWALGDLHEAAGADATPFSRVLEPAADAPAPPALLLTEPDATLNADRTEPASAPVADLTPPVVALAPADTPARVDTPEPVDTPVSAEPDAAVVSPPPLVDVAWAGSVKSALGEVFAKAGHDESLEPPAHPSAVVRSAMADAAVEAAIEDAVLRDDAPPTALASLQQLLASVRARRAALFHDTPS